jgi:hypothetical protein
MSGRIIAREGAMNALHFLVHLIVGTVGVLVAAAVVTFTVVRQLHRFSRLSGRERRHGY